MPLVSKSKDMKRTGMERFRNFSLRHLNTLGTIVFSWGICSERGVNVSPINAEQLVGNSQMVHGKYFNYHFFFTMIFHPL